MVDKRSLSLEDLSKYFGYVSVSQFFDYLKKLKRIEVVEKTNLGNFKLIVESIESDIKRSK